jgi:hypothetical protein
MANLKISELPGLSVLSGPNQFPVVSSGTTFNVTANVMQTFMSNVANSGEGMAQFLALASGREDPAIAEYRKQTQKLDEIRSELRALQQEKVDILGAAA